MTIAKARVRRWLAFVMTVLCLPAFALAADCSCLLSADSSTRESAPACAGATDSGCCTDCCRRGEQNRPSKPPAQRQVSLQGVVGILFGTNFRACAAPTLPVKRADHVLWDVNIVPANAAAALATSPLIVSPPGNSLRDGISPSSVLLRTILRRCRPGNAPPVS